MGLLNVDGRDEPGHDISIQMVEVTRSPRSHQAD